MRLNRKQTRAVDQICLDGFQIPGLLLMEHAALALLAACRDMLGGDVRGRGVTIVCGSGNNGGDGYALARLLTNAGATVTIFAKKPADDLDGDAATNARIAAAMGIAIRSADPAAIGGSACDLLVDALLGTGLDQPPREDAAEIIRAINDNPATTLAVDVPSGLDCDAGRPLGAPSAVVRADRTVTFVADKVGFPPARAWTGDVTVGDIGAPSEAILRAARAA